MSRAIALPLLVSCVLLGCGGTAAKSAEPASVATPTSAPSPGDSTLASTPPHAEPAAPPAPPPPAIASSAPKTAPVKTAGVDDSSLVGQLTPEQLQAILQKYANDFDHCGRMNKAVTYVGKVVMRLTIGPSGKANSVELVNAAPRSAVVESCLTDTFKKVDFPKPKNGQAQIVKFPIEFEKQEQVK